MKNTLINLAKSNLSLADHHAPKKRLHDYEFQSSPKTTGPINIIQTVFNDRCFALRCTDRHQKLTHNIIFFNLKVDPYKWGNTSPIRERQQAIEFDEKFCGVCLKISFSTSQRSNKEIWSVKLFIEQEGLAHNGIVFLYQNIFFII